MIRGFKDHGTEDIYDIRDTRAARRTCPPDVWTVARRKLDYLVRAGALRDLAVPPGNRLEALTGDRAGQHSIRINRQYRICFVWTEQGATDVEIVDYH